MAVPRIRLPRIRLPRSQLTGVAGLAAATMAALVAARPRFSGSLSSWTGDDIALAAAWGLAVACSAWVLVVAAACNLALLARRAPVARRTARLAPGFVRRLVEVAIVGTAVIGTPLPAAAAPPPGPRAVGVYDEPVVRTPPPAAPARKPAPRRTPASAPARNRVHIVRPGDNLWRIARDELIASGDRRPDDTTVAHYWRAVVAANHATLRSRDPSLIFPGEAVTLPESR